jgi:acylphosphatase
MRKLIAHASGKVQMAGYRSRVVIIAKAFDLKGYVRNLPDGRVKIVAEGSEADLERFFAAIRIKNSHIKVEDIKAEFSDAEGAYEDFFKVAGDRETDARLDVAAEHLKELIAAVREGFKETNSRLGEISGKQDHVIDKIDETREEIASTQEEMVSEVRSLRSDLKGRTDERLQRIESDVTEIKVRMRS